jgi:tetratricopeptide (TPR) repeat protein
VLIAAVARQKGADAAIHEAERTIADLGERLQVFEGAAASLVRLRDYATAAALLDHASALSADASVLRSRAAILRQVKPLAELPLPPGEPATAVRRALIFLATSESESDPLPPIFSRALTAGGSSKQALPGILKTRQRVRSNAGAAADGMPITQLIEIGLAAQKETVSGDEALGYRVDYALKVDETARQDFYVVREDDGYRVAATGELLPLLGVEALHRQAAGDLKGARQWLDWARELAAEPAGDPPRPPFSALWTRGAQAGEEETRCAAAVLAAQQAAGEALAVLTACRAAEQDADRQMQFDNALAGTAARAGQWQEVATLAERMLAAKPQSDLPFALATVALLHLHRYDAVTALAERRLERLAGDRAAQLALANVDEFHGDLPGAERRLRQLVKSGNADGTELNELAWVVLAQGRIDEQTLDLAQRGAHEDPTHDAMHTFAAALVEDDKPSEAYKQIVKAIDSTDDRAPVASDWYIFGRLAEQYGLPDEARTLYGRVTRSPTATGPEALSTDTLARRRLAALAAPGPAARK